MEGPAKELILYHMASYGIPLDRQFSLAKLEEALRDMIGTGADILMPLVKKELESGS